MWRVVGVGGCRGGGGWQRDTGGGEQPALVWVRGNGRHRGDGLPAGAQRHGSFVWAAAAHGWVSNHYTEHLQTDKKTNPLGTNGNFCFPSLHALPPSPLLEGFPGGRSEWLLAPQSSLTPSLPAFHPGGHHCVKTGAIVQDVRQAFGSTHGSNTLSSKVFVKIQTLEAIQLKRVLDFHIGMGVVFLGFKPIIEQASKKLGEIHSHYWVTLFLQDALWTLGGGTA